MKKYILLLMAAMLGCFGYAQNSFTAIVKGAETKESLIGVNVLVKLLNIGNDADLNGLVSLTNYRQELVALWATAQ
jgi:hypothetical protein